MSGQEFIGFLGRHRGKIAGTLAGLLLRIGFFGPLLGLALGLFLDEFLGEKQIRRGIEQFLQDPTPQALQKIPQAERAGFLLMIVVRQYFHTLKTGRKSWNSLEAPISRALLGCLDKSRDLRRGMERAAAPAFYPLAAPEIPQEMAKPMITGDQRQKVVNILFSLTSGGEETWESRQFLHRLSHIWGVSPPRDENPDHSYHLLGLPRGASVEEIKQTFRTLAAQFHPDTALHLTETQKSESEEAFRKIRNAYETILREKAGED